LRLRLVLYQEPNKKHELVLCEDIQHRVAYRHSLGFVFLFPYDPCPPMCVL